MIIFLGLSNLRYASYYEALLRSQYNQLYQKNRVSTHHLV